MQTRCHDEKGRAAEECEDLNERTEHGKPFKRMGNGASLEQAGDDFVSISNAEILGHPQNLERRTSKWNRSAGGNLIQGQGVWRGQINRAFQFVMMNQPIHRLHEILIMYP